VKWSTSDPIESVVVLCLGGGGGGAGGDVYEAGAVEVGMNRAAPP